MITLFQSSIGYVLIFNCHAWHICLEFLLDTNRYNENVWDWVFYFVCLDALENLKNFTTFFFQNFSKKVYPLQDLLHHCVLAYSPDFFLFYTFVFVDSLRKTLWGNI